MLMIMLKAVMLSLIWAFSTLIYYMMTDAEPTNKRVLITAGPLAISVIVFLVTLVIML